MPPHLTFEQMEAGSDTTSSTLLTFVLAMTQYPEIMSKAHEEVDRVCGNDRSPTFDDLQNLKYLNACMNEVGHNRSRQVSETQQILTYVDPTMATDRTRRNPSYVDPG
jgi:hypothetical protein